MNKTILIVTPIYPPAVGGPAQYTETLVKKLTKDIKVKVITLSKADTQNKQVISISVKKGFIKRQLGVFRAVFSELAYADTVYVLGTLTVGLASMLACILRKKPYVIKYVGDEVWERYQSGGGTKLLDDYLKGKKRVSDSVFLKLERIILSKAKSVIVPGSFLQNILKIYFNIAATNIPNAVELDKNSKTNKIPNTIVYIGRLVPWKQVDKVIEVFFKLQKKTKNAWSLTIIGDGSEREKLENIVKTQGISNVIFTGNLSKHETIKHLLTQEYLVLYSTYEGMSHTLLDAMAANTKIVASDIKANRDLLENGMYGKLIPLSNKQALLSAFTGDYDMRMLDKAYEYVLREYSWEKHITKITNILLS